MKDSSSLLQINKYSEIIRRQKEEMADLKERTENLEHVNSGIIRTQEFIKTYDSDISQLKTENNDLSTKMEACRKTESDKLELTAKLRKENTELQSENVTLSNKVRRLVGEMQSLKEQYHDVNTKLKGISYTLANKQTLRERDIQPQNTKLAGK